jgi:hypothetical protein
MMEDAERKTISATRRTDVATRHKNARTWTLLDTTSAYIDLDLLGIVRSEATATGEYIVLGCFLYIKRNLFIRIKIRISVHCKYSSLSSRPLLLRSNLHLNTEVA